MSDYTFRGKAISGPGAYALLSSIKRVLAECPDPTPEDMLALETIIKDFEIKMAQDLEKEYGHNPLEDNTEWT